MLFNISVTTKLSTTAKIILIHFFINCLLEVQQGNYFCDEMFYDVWINNKMAVPKFQNSVKKLNLGLFCTLMIDASNF